MTPPNDVTVKNIEIGLLKPAPSNPNVMTEDEVKALVRGVEELGFLQPLLVRPLGDYYEVVDGHHRLQAATELEYTEVPCVVVSDMTEQQVALARIAMNRNRGELDITAVGVAMREMAESFDMKLGELTLTGYSESEVRDLLRTGAEVDAGPMDLEMELPPEAGEFDEDEDDRPESLLFTLELNFATREQLKLVKRKLKKASGKSKNMAEGLLRLLGEDT